MENNSFGARRRVADGWLAFDWPGQCCSRLVGTHKIKNTKSHRLHARDGACRARRSGGEPDRFPFASGGDYTAWTILGFVLKEADSREAGFYTCLVPCSHYRIEDDWFTSGLRGTGSKSLVLEAAFVLEHRWFGPGLERPPMNPHRSARRADGKNWHKLAGYFREGRVQTAEEIRWWRAEESHAAKLAKQAVDRLVNGAGGSSQYAHKPLQRFWRDIHIGCEHPWLDALGINQVVGRLMLGLPRDPSLIM